MKTKRLLILSAIALAMVVTPAAAEMDVDLGVVLGLKQLDFGSDFPNELSDAEDHTEFGIGAFFGKSEWPVMIATDLRMSSGDETITYSYSTRGIYSYSYGLDVDTMELTAGVAKFWGDTIRPYVTGGIAYVDLEAEVSGSFTSPPARGGSTFSAKADDSDVGYFLGGGVLFDIGEKFDIGLDVRYSDATAELGATFDRGTSSTSKFDSGGVHYGVRFGYRF